MSVLGYYRLSVILLWIILFNVKNSYLKYAKYAVMIAVACGLLLPVSAHGYATNFSYGVQAKWANNLNFMICLSSIAPQEYEDLFIKAVEEWKARWNHFAYRISYASGCHINVSIVKTNSMLSEHGYVGYTNIEYWEHGAITKANIILPTSMKTHLSTVVKGKAVTSEVVEPLSKEQFYRAALHEFGHALNLGHFDDNGVEPIDIMYPYPASDDQEQGISQRGIEALNWLYLGYFEQEMTVRTDKKSYKPGDTVGISGKVSITSPGKVVGIEVLEPSNKPYTSGTANLSPSGAFSYKMKIPRETEGGSFKVKASYDNTIADASFDIINPNKASEVSPTSQVIETSLVLPKIEEKVTVHETFITDNSGSNVNSIPSQQQVFVRSSLSSTLAEQAAVTYIIQIKNSEGYTVEISSATYTLASGVSTFSQSWLPDSPDKYTIQIFLWKSTSSPEPLMPTPIELAVIVYDV